MGIIISRNITEYQLQWVQNDHLGCEKSQNVKKIAGMYKIIV